MRGKFKLSLDLTLRPPQMLITPWLERRIAGPRAATNAIFISRLVMSSSPGLHTNKDKAFPTFVRRIYKGVQQWTVLYCTALYSTVYSDGSV